MNVLQGFGLFFLLGGVVGVCGGVERIIRKRRRSAGRWRSTPGSSR